MDLVCCHDMQYDYSVVVGRRRALYCKHHASTVEVIVVFILKNRTESRIELST